MQIPEPKPGLTHTKPYGSVQSESCVQTRRQVRPPSSMESSCLQSYTRGVPRDQQISVTTSPAMRVYFGEPFESEYVLLKRRDLEPTDTKSVSPDQLTILPHRAPLKVDRGSRQRTTIRLPGAGAPVRPMCLHQRTTYEPALVPRSFPGPRPLRSSLGNRLPANRSPLGVDRSAFRNEFDIGSYVPYPPVDQQPPNVPLRRLRTLSRAGVFAITPDQVLLQRQLFLPRGEQSGRDVRRCIGEEQRLRGQQLAVASFYRRLRLRQPSVEQLHTAFGDLVGQPTRINAGRPIDRTDCVYRYKPLQLAIEAPRAERESATCAVLPHQGIPVSWYTVAQQAKNDVGEHPAPPFYQEIKRRTGRMILPYPTRSIDCGYPSLLGRNRVPAALVQWLSMCTRQTVIFLAHVRIR